VMPQNLRNSHSKRNQPPLFCSLKSNSNTEPSASRADAFDQACINLTSFVQSAKWIAHGAPRLVCRDPTKDINGRNDAWLLQVSVHLRYSERRVSSDSLN